ncbi:MAG: T9SS type A sorting domain-containing protein [Saprospiraceae bacterium]|nr:T9SS type A sorting domain-containing protein [Saprospiraceae bacterium]
MRTFSIIIILVFLYDLKVTGQSFVLLNDTISRQSQLDSFTIQYPGCNYVLGNLTITGDIHHLDSLYNIKKIYGTLTVENTKIEDFKGLGQLDTIFGFKCIGNTKLLNLNGMETLTFSGPIYIDKNVVLKEIVAIYQTDFTSFYLAHCPKISLVYGFNTPTILDYIIIEENVGLKTIDAFHNVEEITGDYRIRFCSELESVFTGTKLKIVKNELQFAALSKLQIFPPFENLIQVNNYLTLVSLTSLRQCNSFNNLRSVYALHIYNANSLETLPGFPKLTLISKSLDLGDNNKIRYIDGFNALDSVQGSLRIFSSDSLISVNGFKNLRFIGSQFSVGNLRSLKNINGFGQLNYVEYNVQFYGLSLVTELNVFSNLNHVKKLYIWTNKYLNDISWLNNLNVKKLEELQIISNDSLSFCNYEAICNYLNENKGKHEIRFNKSGCNSAEEILEACRTVGVDDLQEKDLTIYPNPTNNHFYIESNAELGSDDIEIWTMTGSKVPFSRVGDAIYPHTLDGGILIVKIKISGQTLVKKIIYLP